MRLVPECVHTVRIQAFLSELLSLCLRPGSLWVDLATNLGATEADVFELISEIDMKIDLKSSQ